MQVFDLQIVVSSFNRFYLLQNSVKWYEFQP